MILKDRAEAANLLIKKLFKYKGHNPLILGIPRGAMPMASIIAEALSGELNAILIHKIPAPMQDELAIGSVGLSGEIYRSPLIQRFEISESYIQKEAQLQIENLKKRKTQFALPDFNAKGRVVVIVDDGIATGATAIAAVKEVRKQNPKKIILAAGVVSASAAIEMRKIVDELIVLEEPEEFYSVSQFFENFAQVTDDEVVSILAKKRS